MAARRFGNEVNQVGTNITRPLGGHPNFDCQRLANIEKYRSLRIIDRCRPRYTYPTSEESLQR